MICIREKFFHPLYIFFLHPAVIRHVTAQFTDHSIMSGDDRTETHSIILVYRFFIMGRQLLGMIVKYRLFHIGKIKLDAGII